jgi:hypothetical protein
MSSLTWWHFDQFKHLLKLIHFQSSSSSNEPPDEATAQAVANAFLKSVGESMSNDAQTDEINDTSDEDLQMVIFFLEHLIYFGVLSIRFGILLILFVLLTLTK